jgi:hypothetical protein
MSEQTHCEHGEHIGNACPICEYQAGRSSAAPAGSVCGARETGGPHITRPWSEGKCCYCGLLIENQMTDTERLNALFTLFGGNCAFPPFFKIQELFRDGRRGLDVFIKDNPALLGNSPATKGKA